VLERGRRLSSEKDFQGKEPNQPQAKSHNVSPSACKDSRKPPLDTGFIFKDSDLVYESIRKEINVPKDKSSLSSLNIFGIIYQESPVEQHKVA